MHSFVLLALFACSKGSDSADYTVPQTDSGGPLADCPDIVITWTDDGEEPRDTNGDGVDDAGCGDSVHIQAVAPCPKGFWRMGMVVAALNDFAPEDCHKNEDSVCHRVKARDHTLQQTCDPGQVNATAYTSYGADDADKLTWYFEAPDGSCFVKGRNPEWYERLNCGELPP